MGEWKSNICSEGIKICFCFPSYKHDSATCCMIKKQFQHSWCGRWLFPAETNPLTVGIGKRWWFKYEDIHLDAPATALSLRLCLLLCTTPTCGVRCETGAGYGSRRIYERCRDRASTRGSWKALHHNDAITCVVCMFMLITSFTFQSFSPAITEEMLPLTVDFRHCAVASLIGSNEKKGFLFLIFEAF